MILGTDNFEAFEFAAFVVRLANTIVLAYFFCTKTRVTCSYIFAIE